MLDVNVVVSAHRDDHPLYDVVGAWFDDLLAGSDPFAVPVIVWTSFLRLATGRHVFDPPTGLGDAFAFLEAVCAQPHHVPLAPGRRHMALLRRICEEANVTGNVVPDAVIAAIALEHNCAVATLDRDFARFRSIEHVIPG